MPPLQFHPKVAAGALATALTVIVVYSLQQWAGIVLPDTVSAAVTAVIGFAAGWLAPSPQAVPAVQPPAPTPQG